MQNLQDVIEVKENYCLCWSCSAPILASPSQRAYGLPKHVSLEPGGNTANANAASGSGQLVSLQEHANVRGNFLEMVAWRDPRQHAIGLVIGRCVIWCVKHNVAEYLFPSLLTMFSLAGVDIGHLHHSPKAARAFVCVSICVLHRSLAHAFWKELPNLPCSSCFRLACPLAAKAHASCDDGLFRKGGAHHGQVSM